MEPTPIRTFPVRTADPFPSRPPDLRDANRYTARALRTSRETRVPGERPHVTAAGPASPERGGGELTDGTPRPPGGIGSRLGPGEASILGVWIKTREEKLIRTFDSQEFPKSFRGSPGESPLGRLPQEEEPFIDRERDRLRGVLRSGGGGDVVPHDEMPGADPRLLAHPLERVHQG